MNLDAFARIVAMGFCVFAAGSTLRLVVAEMTFPRSFPSLATDASLYERLAEKEPENAEVLWLRAATLNPRSSAAWIALGLAAERRGDFAEAERDLLQAARVDHQYLPAWSLSSFYFRRAKASEFWPWARRAAALAYDDRGPLLDLCDRMDSGGMFAHLGDSPEIEDAYLDLLIRRNRWSDAQEVARKIGARGASDERARLVAFTTRQIDAGNGGAAREIWDGLFPGASTLTNGDLRTLPSGEGFDWKMGAMDGIRWRWRESRIGFSFSGHEPDACVLMEQPLMLDAGSYCLRCEYSAFPGHDMTGLRWAIDSKLTKSKGPILQAASGNREWSFSVAQPELARLKLFYRRDAGSRPAEGEVEVRNIRLEVCGNQHERRRL